MHMFDPPQPKCERKISDDEEAHERMKWRDALHGNKGAATRTLASARNASKEQGKSKEASQRLASDIAEQVAEAALKLLEQTRRNKH